MKSAVACLAVATVAISLPARSQPRGDQVGVDIPNAAARVVVIPEARSDVDVRITSGDPRLPPLAPRADRGRIVIDGGLANRVSSCRAQGVPPRREVNVRGIGWIAYERLPVITLRTPLHTRVGASGAVWGEVGPSETLDLAHGGCGDWTVAPVRGPFHLAVTGSGDTRARTAGSLKSATNGSGDLQMDAVAGPTDIAIDGSGDVRIGRIDGPLATATAGSGDIHIEAGRAPSVEAHIAGSGDVIFGGEAGALTAAVNGSGDVHVARVTGPVTKAVHGSGEVTVGR